MTATPSITVVIPARNAEKTVGEQIASLRSQFDGTFEVILVDNASEDRTAEIARVSAGSMPLTILHESRRGANWARNAGIKAAGTERILLCDADDIVSHDWVATLANALEPGTWVSGCVEVTRLNHRRTITIRQRNLPFSTTPEPIALGGNCALNRSDWEAIGGFDVRLSGGGDETEFFARLTRSGCPGRFEPAAVIHYRLRPGMISWLRDQHRAGLSHQRMVEMGIGGTINRRHARWNLAIRIVAHSALLVIDVWRLGPRSRRLGASAYYLGRLGFRSDVVEWPTSSR